MKNLYEQFNLGSRRRTWIAFLDALSWVESHTSDRGISGYSSGCGYPAWVLRNLTVPMRECLQRNPLIRRRLRRAVTHEDFMGVLEGCAERNELIHLVKEEIKVRLS